MLMLLLVSMTVFILGPVFRIKIGAGQSTVNFSSTVSAPLTMLAIIAAFPLV